MAMATVIVAAGVAIMVATEGRIVAVAPNLAIAMMLVLVLLSMLDVVVVVIVGRLEVHLGVIVEE